MEYKSLSGSVCVCVGGFIGATCYLLLKNCVKENMSWSLPTRRLYAGIEFFIVNPILSDLAILC